ncbi:MAG: hypothetical protein CLLPBCKN_001374 [Chroococcidiopsis cubana SAG 39.79]|uniref:Virulence-associated protein E-like domain-containing protein n=1 Tax=Chroococcidiopsis cubana SAG 39.79 TaxID=388085 RepID=A0AB37UE58_9CYAN|nr:virulence-associated E family protein [Chroococcidiopsis cubana]MDZ4871986.1 hypothetical protein [Chroococcidiopsis cubana SAG 39.79]PSB57196.1 hypothetical protein C7B79_31265 [Chroococcidiopsis cubana CCALA 043]RUT06350.1 hypothetical protein DSM107010_52950 [Chroococcidiopsis cubana SAG 39.79]
MINHSESGFQESLPNRNNSVVEQGIADFIITPAQVSMKVGLYQHDWDDCIKRGLTPEFIIERIKDGTLYSFTINYRNKLPHFPHIIGSELVEDVLVMRFSKAEPIRKRQEFAQIKPKKEFYRNGKRLKYLSPSGVQSQAYIPPDCKAITEGMLDALVGRCRGGISIGALAGVSHFRKALPEGHGYTILFDADGRDNPSVIGNLYHAGKHGKCKIQLIPRIKGEPKAGIEEYFKAGYTADDFKQLIESALKPDDFLRQIIDELNIQASPKLVEYLIKLAANNWTEFETLAVISNLEKRKIIDKPMSSCLRKKVKVILRKTEQKKHKVSTVKQERPAWQDDRLIETRRLESLFDDHFGDKLQYDIIKQVSYYEGKPLLEQKLERECCKLLDKDLTKYRVLDAAYIHAKHHEYNYPKIYLNEVKKLHPETNGVIERVARKILGVDHPLEIEYLKRWAVGAVKRVHEPGCQFDTALILQGAQGLLKTSFFVELAGFDAAGKPLFHKESRDLKDKDAIISMHRHWIVQLDEIEVAVTRHETGTMRNFMDARYDSFRHPYGRVTEEMPRRFVLCGTVNPQRFLVDEHGNRRYWVIAVKKKIDIDLVKELRDQFWAEAMHLYEEGCSSYLTDAMQVLSNELNKKYEVEGTWDEMVEEFLQSRIAPVSTTEIYQHLDVEPSEYRRHDVWLNKCLTRLGWTKNKFRYQGQAPKHYWEKPNQTNREAE